MRKRKKLNLEERFQEMLEQNINPFSFFDNVSEVQEKDFAVVKGKKIFGMRQTVEIRKIEPLMVEEIIE